MAEHLTADQEVPSSTLGAPFSVTLMCLLFCAGTKYPKVCVCGWAECAVEKVQQLRRSPAKLQMLTKAVYIKLKHHFYLVCLAGRRVELCTGTGVYVHSSVMSVHGSHLEANREEIAAAKSEKKVQVWKNVCVFFTVLLPGIVMSHVQILSSEATTRIF